MSNAMKHSKKRNAGLLYAFLTLKVSSAIIEGNNAVSSRALKTIKRYFKPGSELYNEFRLINSLVKTTVSSDGVATSIINEAKNAVRKHDASKLDREKSLLIREINHKLNVDGSFYDQHVHDYRAYATVQTLINEWRNERPNIGIMAEREDELVKWLLSNKERSSQQLNEESPGKSRLIMKVMMNKLNEKYDGQLSNRQKAIVRDYVWSVESDNRESLKKNLIESRERLVESLGQYVAELGDSAQEHILKPINEVRSNLLNETFDVIDDALVVRFLRYVQLDDECRASNVT